MAFSVYPSEGEAIEASFQLLGMGLPGQHLLPHQFGPHAESLANIGKRIGPFEVFGLQPLPGFPVDALVTARGFLQVALKTRYGIFHDGQHQSNLWLVGWFGPYLVPMLLGCDDVRLDDVEKRVSAINARGVHG